ncbi:MAG TPA: carboxylating nicotinate-nucleotide diphosphorylase [Rhizomicrobium sp.]|nr:carboxylating nicotinate-nucleotide diphosphorylase [Rhizomicrobium sp.]
MNNLDLAFARPPHPLIVEPIVRRALEEDFGRGGDLTTDLIVSSGQHASAKIVARQSGVLAGIIAAECAFRLVDISLRLEPAAMDGQAVAASDLIAHISGSARGILSAERVALNFIGHLSGVATATHMLVDAVVGTKARIVCTRKTIPGMRALEKYAVRCGGGFNHRFGLDDAVLIKDNHIAAAGGIPSAIERVRQGLGHMVRIEIEVDTLSQLDQALALGVDTVLLDNMTIEEMKQAVALTRGRAILEASGGVTAASVHAIAETGIDYISVGAITHSARSLDVALDF